jgi:hypothetical protein
MVRPKKYATEEERLAARREQGRRSTAKHRAQARASAKVPDAAPGRLVFRHVTFPDRAAQPQQPQQPQLPVEDPGVPPPEREPEPEPPPDEPPDEQVLRHVSLKSDIPAASPPHLWRTASRVIRAPVGGCPIKTFAR